MLFWLRRLSAICCGVTPSAARRALENSTYTRSACLPMTSIFLTFGTCSSRRLTISATSDMPARSIAVALDRVHQAVDIAVLVVEHRADNAFGQFAANVLELLARLVPGFALVLLRGAALHGDGHAAVALAGERRRPFRSCRVARTSSPCGSGLRPAPAARVAPGQATIAVIDGTEKFGSSSCPRRGNPIAPAMETMRIRNKTTARCSSAHWVRLKDFMARLAASSAAVASWSGSATTRPGDILWTPAVTTTVPSFGPDTSTASLRYPRTATGTSSTRAVCLPPTGRATQTAGLPSRCVNAVAGTEAAGAPAPIRSAISVALAPSGRRRPLRPQACAIRARLRCRLGGDFANSTSNDVSVARSRGMPGIANA